MVKIFRSFILALCLVLVAAGPLAAQSPKPTSKVIQTAASTGNGSVYSSAGRYEHLTIVVDFRRAGPAASSRLRKRLRRLTRAHGRL
jgi:hypothetical protein